MSKSDWLRFYHAVDEFLPDLMERLAHHFGKFTEQQQQVCYLMRIGLTNSQIHNCLGPRDRYMNRLALVLRIFLPHPYIACRTIRGTGGSMVPVPATPCPCDPRRFSLPLCEGGHPHGLAAITNLKNHEIELTGDTVKGLYPYLCF